MHPPAAIFLSTSTARTLRGVPPLYSCFFFFSYSFVTVPSVSLPQDPLSVLSCPAQPSPAQHSTAQHSDKVPQVLFSPLVTCSTRPIPQGPVFSSWFHKPMPHRSLSLSLSLSLLLCVWLSGPLHQLKILYQMLNAGPPLFSLTLPNAVSLSCYSSVFLLSPRPTYSKACSSKSR